MTQFRNTLKQIFYVLFFILLCFGIFELWNSEMSIFMCFIFTEFSIAGYIWLILILDDHL
jgi:hypothetical protein